MTRNISQIIYDSRLAGLANYDTRGFFFNITAHSLTPGSVSAWNATYPLNNDNAISSIQLNYGNLEGVWRPVSGATVINVPYVGTQYQLLAFTYRVGALFKMSIYVVNETGSTINIPAIQVNVRIFMFNAPF